MNVMYSKRLAIAVLSGALAFPGSSRGPGPAVLRAQAAERHLYVSALDPNGAPVANLGVTDFVVREDGVAREVLRVRRATDPMQIALVVDTSQAATDAILDIRDALSGFIDRMQGGNEIALIGFGDRPTILADYSTSSITVKKGIGRLFAIPNSGSYLLDAILEVSRGFERREAGRPVILAITAEGTEYSNLTYEPVLKSLTASGAAFHAVILTSRSPEYLRDEERNRNLVLDLGTKATGGRRDNLLTPMTLVATLKKVAEELSNQYLVTYARPESLIPPQKTAVTAANPGLTVRGTPVRVPKGA